MGYQESKLELIAYIWIGLIAVGIMYWLTTKLGNDLGGLIFLILLLISVPSIYLIKKHLK